MIKIENYKGLIGEDLNEWYSVSEAFELEDAYVFVIKSYLDHLSEFTYRLSRTPNHGFYQLSISNDVPATPFHSTTKVLGDLLINHANISNKFMIKRNMLSLAQSIPSILNTKKERQ
jgi:hypothetical protein